MCYEYISISWVAWYHCTGMCWWNCVLLCFDSASTGPSGISTPRACTHVHTDKVSENTHTPSAHICSSSLPLCSEYILRLLQVWEPPSHSHNHVPAAWHYRKIMMCRPVGSFISMFYNRRRVEVIKLCHHYNEQGPPLNRHPMRH